MNASTKKPGPITDGPRAHGATTCVHRTDPRNKTGVVGISLTLWRGKPVYIVAPSKRKFNLRTLGKDEAWRRAVQHRAAHEQAVTARRSSSVSSVNSVVKKSS